jgi:hypothetical protein
MTALPQHDSAADLRIIEAIEWYTAFRGARERPAVPLLQERFGLSAAEACAVIRETSLRHARAH